MGVNQHQWAEPYPTGYGQGLKIGGKSTSIPIFTFRPVWLDAAPPVDFPFRPVWLDAAPPVDFSFRPVWLDAAPPVDLSLTVFGWMRLRPLIFPTVEFLF